jgi:hypothetical protein
VWLIMILITLLHSTPRFGISLSFFAVFLNLIDGKAFSGNDIPVCSQLGNVAAKMSPLVNVISLKKKNQDITAKCTKTNLLFVD